MLDSFPKYRAPRINDIGILPRTAMIAIRQHRYAKAPDPRHVSEGSLVTKVTKVLRPLSPRPCYHATRTGVSGVGGHKSEFFDFFRAKPSRNEGEAPNGISRPGHLRFRSLFARRKSQKTRFCDQGVAPERTRGHEKSGLGFPSPLFSSLLAGCGYSISWLICWAKARGSSMGMPSTSRAWL